jgi:heme-degrading monooxygenase HmoA
MIIQKITFITELTEEEVLKVAHERADDFRALPGLIQKYYFKTAGPNQYGGLYIWGSEDQMAKYRASDLAKSIPTAYKVKGMPEIETLDILFELRD